MFVMIEERKWMDTFIDGIGSLDVGALDGPLFLLLSQS